MIRPVNTLSWSVQSPLGIVGTNEAGIALRCFVENAASRIREHLGGLAEDVVHWSSLFINHFGVGMINASAAGVAALTKSLGELTQIAMKVDRKQLEAALNRLEFSLRECEGATTRGVRYLSSRWKLGYTTKIPWLHCV